MEKLTLAGLAKKLETLTEKVSGLEHENERIRTENTGLRERVAELTATAKDSVADVLAPDSSPVFEGAMSRRALFSKAGAAAVVATAAGMMLTPREAKAAETFREGVGVFTNNGGGLNQTFIGYANAGVQATHNRQHGVIGRTRRIDYSGVYGISAASRNGIGVRGESDNDGGRGVYGFGQYGVQGDSSRTNGYGVYGAMRDQASGSGVYGRADGGYGGRFKGGKAQLYLIPNSTRGVPTTGYHRRGEIFMDAITNLFVCYASGTPGEWIGISTYDPNSGGD